MIPGNRHSTSGLPEHEERGLPWPPEQWRRELMHSVTSAHELLELLGVAPEDEANEVPCNDFPVRVPRPYISRMRPGDRHDPLLRQVLPSSHEADTTTGFQHDALAEAEAIIDTGVLQKYAGRALLIATGTCAVNCRYCFRRHFPYAEHRQDSHFPGLAAVYRDPSIEEVILSGGDPLMLTDKHLATLVDQIGAIGHVTRLRIHTRTPVVIPQRITAGLIEILDTARPRVVIVLHFNHPNEIDSDCRRAMAALNGFTLLNQSVLLRDVNDDVETLRRLSEQLFDAGVLPYYLHMPDPVSGTAHFDVKESRAAAIHNALAAKLPGYLVPKLVREVPGTAGKQPIIR